MEFVTLIIGFVILIKAADYFVDASVNVAKIFRISEVIIGATIVSIGTTLPETMVSAMSAFKGHGDIAFGNALGSIICNTALVAAISLIFSQNKINKNNVKVPCIFFLISYLIYVFSAYKFNYFYRPVGIVLISLFFIYSLYIVYTHKNDNKDKMYYDNDLSKDNVVIVHDNRLYKNIIILIVTAILIAIASNMLIDSATIIARKFNVPEAVIGITIVALGTSLPELTTAITSLIKGHSNLSFGNVIGANLFNLLLVSGLAITIRPFAVPSGKVIFGINSTLLVDLPLAIIVMMILCIPALIKGETKRWQGGLLIFIYIVFIIYQVSII